MMALEEVPRRMRTQAHEFKKSQRDEYRFFSDVSSTKREKEMLCLDCKVWQVEKESMPEDKET